MKGRGVADWGIGGGVGEGLDSCTIWALKDSLPSEELIVTRFNDIGLTPARRC